MARFDYYDDPNAPPATSLVPGGSAIVTNDVGEILLQRRTDNQLWSLPGGKMEIGETLAQAIIREVREETGLQVQPEQIVGIYSDPKHIIAYSDVEVRQEFSICLACRIVGGEIRVSEESSAVRFFAPARSSIWTCIPRSACASATTSSEASQFSGSYQRPNDQGSQSQRQSPSRWLGEAKQRTASAVDGFGGGSVVGVGVVGRVVEL